MNLPRSVARLLTERADADPDMPFVEASGVGRTLGELRDRADRLAAGLSSLGVAKDDRVATILPSTIDHVDLIFACARLGAIHVPINVFLKGEFLSYQLSDSGASVVVADEPGAEAVERVRGSLPGLRHVVRTGVELDQLARTSTAAPDVPVDIGDTLAIVYTSGTTGMPKGCMLPHGYHLKAAASGREMLDYRKGDVLFTANPLFHGWARGMLFGALVHRMALVLEAEFSASSALDRICETKATVFSGVGAMGMALLATSPSAKDRAHRLRLAFMIPFPPVQQEAFLQRFGVPVQSQMYGQTETGAITFSRLGEPGNPASVGRASPHYDVRVVDEEDHDVVPAVPGEVIVRAKEPDVMYSGYWGKPDETTEAMRGGWHHTGDLATLDADGYLTFVDRKKDALRRRGENVSSVQLEAAIIAHPKIAEAAVVAVPSEMTEDDIKVCIVLQGEETVDPEELFGFFGEKLPYFAVPRYVEVMDALPKTATMRVQKHVLRERGVGEGVWDFEELGLRIDRAQRR